ncbi:polysaccharide biosynthesis protein, partial [Endozoicomonas sp. YOMI1]|uniref:polysaccharide biosynthesis protein n=1 Tax=Endozoicomonas sp. YOMI1 TaxID=2828739 RepID=UPI0021477A0A
MSHQVLLTILKAAVASILMLIAVFYLLGINNMPRGVTVLYCCFSGLFLSLTRYGVRQWLRGYTLKDVVRIIFSIQPVTSPKQVNKAYGIPVLIYGAGAAGVQLAEALNKSREYHPVGFLDDNDSLKGRVIMGKRIYHLASNIEQVIRNTGAEEILLAIPSLGRSRRAEILRNLELLGMPIKTMPGLSDLASGRLKIQEILDVMRRYSVETLYHAAAYKHVPIVQHNVSEGLRNNVLGTLYTAQAAIIAGVKNFVLISTDKAVRPTNVMGASKRLAEMVLQALSQEKLFQLYHPELFGFHPGDVINNITRFTMVRFGNVLGSSG